MGSPEEVLWWKGKKLKSKAVDVGLQALCHVKPKHIEFSAVDLSPARALELSANVANLSEHLCTIGLG